MLLSRVSRMVRVLPVPALEDNYMYIVYNEKTKVGAAVDPVEPAKIRDVAHQNGISLSAALVTHHHWDHAGGMGEFRKIWKEVPIYGGDERIEHMTKEVKHEEKFRVGEMEVTCLSTPCHTRGHICYHVVDGEGEAVVLTGDTLFVAGCGKFFEGEACEMDRALNEVLSSLRDETLVYPGHEYTASNLRFAAHIEPDNKEIAAKLAWCGSHPCTVPSSIGEEKKINPFMRTGEHTVAKAVGGSDAIEVMHNLREAKNNFRAVL